MLNTEESRAGAMACLNAMRIIQSIEECPRHDCSIDGHWRNQETERDVMLNAAGVESGFLAGFISAVAEYAEWTISTGTPDLNKWKPIAAMTDEERAKHRIEFDERLAEVITA